MTDRLLELGGRAAGDYLSMIDYGEPPAELIRFLQVLRGQEYGDAVFLVQLVQLVPYRRSGLGV